jgi:outer membrane protein assembly factor BamB
MGAKLYVRAEKGMTPGYLQRAAVCHAISRETPSYVHDPLRVDGKIESIRVYGNGGSFVIAVTADNRGTGSEIWERAKALTTEVDISEAEGKARQGL